jgi:peroxiredoxin
MRAASRLFSSVVIAATVTSAAAAHADRFSSSSSKPAAKKEEKRWLGVTCRVGSHGVLVEEVIPLTPAEAAGTHVGDQIFQVEGQEVTSPTQLFSVLQQYAIGQEVELRIRRDDRRRTLSAVLGRHLDEEEIFDQRWRDQTAPEFLLDVAHGSAPGKLAAMRGDVVVIALFGSEWPSANVVARLGTLADRHGDRGLWVMAAIRRDDMRELGELAERDSVRFSLLRDPKDELRSVYLKQARLPSPAMVVIDRDGFVRYAGAGQDRLDEVEAAVKDALRDRNGIDLR